MKLSYSDYWAEVASLSNELLENNSGDLYEDIHDLIQEHSYLIYTYNVISLLLHTDNLDYVDEMLGVSSSGTGVYDTLTSIAYWAFYKDIMDKVGL